MDRKKENIECAVGGHNCIICNSWEECDCGRMFKKGTSCNNPDCELNVPEDENHG